MRPADSGRGSDETFRGGAHGLDSRIHVETRHALRRVPRAFENRNEGRVRVSAAVVFRRSLFQVGRTRTTTGARCCATRHPIRLSSRPSVRKRNSSCLPTRSRSSFFVLVLSPIRPDGNEQFAAAAHLHSNQRVERQHSAVSIGNLEEEAASSPAVRSSKTYLILLLTATTLGGAALAWRQYGELVELRASAMNRDERADLQKRVWDLEKANRELQDRLAANRDPADLDGMLAAAADGAQTSQSRERGGRGERGDSRGRGGNSSGLQQATAIRDLMAKPEVQAMVSFQQKAAIEARYAALFKNLNLPAEQLERLKTLLADRSTTMQDVMAAAREQGINPRENPEAFRKVMADAQNQINAGIKAAIGEQGFAQLSTYEQTLPQRNLVNELQQRLSYTSTPLTAAQAEQMVQILATNTPQQPTNQVTSNNGGQPQTGTPPGGRGGPTSRWFRTRRGPRRNDCWGAGRTRDGHAGRNIRWRRSRERACHEQRSGSGAGRARSAASGRPPANPTATANSAAAATARERHDERESSTAVVGFKERR